jgi:hypothetical protein
VVVILKINDAVGDYDDIVTAVNEGYFVRTFADDEYPGGLQEPQYLIFFLLTKALQLLSLLNNK